MSIIENRRSSRRPHAFLAHLLAYETGVVVNVASGLGSQPGPPDPARMETMVVARACCSSKSALVMLTTQYVKALPTLRMDVGDPGYTATDSDRNSGTQTLAEGTDAIVAKP